MAIAAIPPQKLVSFTSCKEMKMHFYINLTLLSAGKHSIFSTRKKNKNLLASLELHQLIKYICLLSKFNEIIYLKATFINLFRLLNRESF